MGLRQVEKMTEYLCHKAQFTNVTYYMTSFSLDEAADGLHYENEVIDGASFADRMQRKINKDRAEKEILNEYLLKEGTRFFNAIVVTFVPNSSSDKGFLEEEALGMDFVKLSVKKDIKKFVLDGQHRLYALRLLREKVIKQEVNSDILKNIKIPIIFIVFNKIPNSLESDEKIRESIIRETRTVFTSLNKTAKPIDKYTALITDDGDLSAVSARKLLESGDVDEKYVKWSIPSSSLNVSEPYFTTLSLINDFFDICESNFNEPIQSNLTFEDRMNAVEVKYFDFVEELGFNPSILIRSFYDEIVFFEEWKQLLITNTIDLPKQPSLPDMNKVQKDAVKKLRQSNILATVAGQRALFGAIVTSYNKVGSSTKEKSQIIFDRVNKISKQGFFDRDSRLWELILVRNNKNRSMITKSSNIYYAEKLINIVLTQSEKNIPEFANDIYDELGCDKRIDKDIEKYIQILKSS